MYLSVYGIIVIEIEIARQLERIFSVSLHVSVCVCVYVVSMTETRMNRELLRMLFVKKGTI